jgi:aminopeptidase
MKNCCYSFPVFAVILYYRVSREKEVVYFLIEPFLFFSDSERKGVIHMADVYLQKLARVLVHYSFKLKAGERFVIRAPEVAAPLVRAVYREALRAGAHVYPIIHLDGMREIFFQEANDEQLSYTAPVEQFVTEHFDAGLTIWAEQNTRALTRIDPARLALYKRAHATQINRQMQREAEGAFRWCGTLFPTHAHAQDAGMSLADFEAFVYRAELLDEEDPLAAWQKVHDEQKKLVDFLMQHDEIHVVTPDTDVTYRTGGRKWINCDGRYSMPDGEVFSSPIENSVNGTVRFRYPANRDGNLVEDIRLTFRDGKVIESYASRGLEYLNMMLDRDAGARYLGEVAFGTNYNIQEATGHTLFDEKIGGTMHMALGASIRLTGGMNESADHWDLVCDLHEGKVYADGKLCYENGRFLI